MRDGNGEMETLPSYIIIFFNSEYKKEPSKEFFLKAQAGVPECAWM